MSRINTVDIEKGALVDVNSPATTTTITSPEAPWPVDEEKIGPIQRSDTAPPIPPQSALRRKPVASTATNHDKPLPPLINDKEAEADVAPGALPHPPTYSTFAHGTTRSFRRSKALAAIDNLKSHWGHLTRRMRILVVAAILALLALILGLAIGLSKHGQPRVSNLPLPSSHGGPYTGDLTYYAPALGSCGITSTSADAIVAVSHLVYDAVSTGSNPNANPLCGKKIRVRRDGKSVDVTVVDRCVGCAKDDLDVTESVFSSLANIDQGRVTASWSWLEDVPTGA